MGQKRKSTEELVEELKAFNHKEAAARLATLLRIVRGAGLCEHCGRTNCDRMRT